MHLTLGGTDLPIMHCPSKWHFRLVVRWTPLGTLSRILNYLRRNNKKLPSRNTPAKNIVRACSRSPTRWSHKDTLLLQCMGLDAADPDQKSKPRARKNDELAKADCRRARSRQYRRARAEPFVPLLAPRRLAKRIPEIYPECQPG